jgi:hypothetical protein
MREQLVTKQGKGLWPQNDFLCTAPEPILAEIKTKQQERRYPRLRPSLSFFVWFQKNLRKILGSRGTSLASKATSKRASQRGAYQKRA